MAGVDYGTSRELLIPFGLSPEGLSWIDPRGVNVTVSGLPQKTVTLAGNNIQTQKGSQIDIRGGGDLFAYRWIPGVGGSVDILGETETVWGPTTEYQPGDLVKSGGKTWSARGGNSGEQPATSLFWTEVQDASPFSPISGVRLRRSCTTGSPRPLAAILVTSAVRSRWATRFISIARPGWKLGRYTLLPRRYALLPGAFLVRPTTSLARGIVPLLDGSTLTPGYRFNGFNAPSEQSPVLSQFRVLPRDTFDAWPPTRITLGRNFSAAPPNCNDLAAQQELPIDAGYLSFAANVGLRPEGNVLAGRPF